ncbi:SEC-C metal-binding domain-containing protein [Moritella sp. Urea-trap-13]|uniref:SEC-C metal-binding domain-containing protein n=1 Tax=Moritella sp. Urea-trap-13 TaxID=2058327 RepID=UPI0018E2DCC9|nr:SEC-C metal-binding domain-containing protein [Moritella sp. Urea-trap-13]
MTGNRSGPCPKCGGMGSVPDGVFNVLEGAIEILNAPARTVEQLMRYVQVLNTAKEQHLSSEEVKERIDKEAPELSLMCMFLPKNFSDLCVFLTLIVTFLMYVSSLNASDNFPSENQVEYMINSSIEQMLMKQEIEQLSEDNEKLKQQNLSRPYRNSLCECDSGKRYKACCGQLI